MDTLWEKVKKNLRDWYGTAYEKTDEIARIGKKKIEIVGINRAIEKRLSELGGRVYDLISSQNKPEEVAEDDKVKELVDKIRELEEQLKLKEREIETIKKETGEREREENQE
ncbi:MAG: hypothetical protein B6D63_00025 [Candidatus Latescibacteria bacterium 4484_7]|nr:MAG: hypothetical protein B6D63_00025 [Candidatus Latescibacteria bacterium 4484_7]RKZ07257.1 MAG: hypothetical protein DRQ05_03415 [bacterium]